MDDLARHKKAIRRNKSREIRYKSRGRYHGIGARGVSGSSRDSSSDSSDSQRSQATSENTDESETDFELGSESEEHWMRRCADLIPPDVMEDWSNSAHGKEQLRAICPPYTQRRTPKIHRGPGPTAIHTKLHSRGLAAYKFVFQYHDPPGHYVEVLKRVTDVLSDQYPVLMCKTYTNPGKKSRNVIVYISQCNMAQLLRIAQIISATLPRLER